MNFITTQNNKINQEHRGELVNKVNTVYITMKLEVQGVGLAGRRPYIISSPEHRLHELSQQAFVNRSRRDAISDVSEAFDCKIRYSAVLERRQLQYSMVSTDSAGLTGALRSLDSIT